MEKGIILDIIYIWNTNKHRGIHRVWIYSGLIVDNIKNGLMLKEMLKRN